MDPGPLNVNDKVFSIKLLRDMIVEGVVNDLDEKNAISNVRSCRLVNKDWFLSTSISLRKSREPLFRLHLFGDHDHIGQLINDFVNVVSPPSLSDAHYQVPPFAIRVDTDSLSTNNCQNLFNLLLDYKGGFVAFHLKFGSRVPFTLNGEFTFPALKKLKIELFGDGRIFLDQILFVQSLIDKCTCFKTFTLVSYTLGNNCLPNTFHLPTSLTELRLKNFLVDDDDSEVFLTNLPPTLKKLKLQNVQIKDGLVSHILTKVRETIEVFDFSFCGATRGSIINPATFLLPHMEKLKSLKIKTEYLELEENLISLEHLVPALNHLSLTWHKDSGFRKWTERSQFFTVESLETSLCLLEENGHTTGVNFDQYTMEIMKRAFPNLQKLDIRICNADTSVLMFIMKEMTNLKYLRIDANGSDDQLEIVHSEFWNSTLLGIPLEDAAALKLSPELWKDLQEKSLVSIRNLTDLDTFSLSSLHGDSVFELSSAVFLHAFLLMPNLNNLILEAGLHVSKDMQKEWISRGHSIDIHSGDDE